MKREKGYLKLENYQILDRNCKGKTNIYKKWLTDGNQEYFFKEENELARYKEIFYSFILQSMGFTTAEYDLATFEHKDGIISPNYNPNNYISFNMAEILRWYSKQEITKNYNVQSLIEIVKKYIQSETKYTFTTEMEENIVNHFLMQIFLGNSDLNATNIEMITNGQVVFSPFYDLSCCGRISPVETSAFYQFNYFKGPKLNAQEMVLNFLNKGDKKHIELLKEYLERAKEINIETGLKEIQNRIECEIPYCISGILRRELRSHTTSLDTIIHNR